LSHIQVKSLTRWFTSYTAEGEPGSVVVFGIDDKRAYWLWGASNPELRDAHTGTAVVWDGMMKLAREEGIEVDLEGVNSPHRGWFKLSFGGTLEPYWQVRLG
jgi:lipid II:glycine glycyltransferase (peptidoglycan interpeptide bridge formation enzyme)